MQYLSYRFIHHMEYIISFLRSFIEILNEIRKPLRHAFMYSLHDFCITKKIYFFSFLRIHNVESLWIIILNHCENWDEKFIPCMHKCTFVCICASSFHVRRGIKFVSGQWTAWACIFQMPDYFQIFSNTQKIGDL